MRRRHLVTIGVVALCLAILLASYAFRDEIIGPPNAPEVALLRIPLSGGAERPEAEISGLTWYRGDRLILLPQYPSRFGGVLFVLDRSAIEAAISSHAQGALAVRTIPFAVEGLEEAIPHFDGFEAIAIVGDEVYVSIEARPDPDHTVGYLMRGFVQGDLDRIVLDVSHRARLANQTDLLNTAYEAIFVEDDRVTALYEANGVINPRPRAMRFDRALEPEGFIRMAHLEYRLTDATSVDADRRFWVANYHWPDSPWDTGACELTERYGEGETHARCRTVERLVEMQIWGDRIGPTDRAPILLQLTDDQHARNWEGIVRLPGRGFLIVTDEHPDSILAFVPAEI